MIGWMITMNKQELMDIFDEYIPDPKCSLDYTKDYELLIATVLSAQCSDARVNVVTKILFNKYDLKSLSEANVDDIRDIIRPCGNMNRKSIYIKEIANRLVNECDGVVPNNREYLESLPGVGRKVCNVVLANIFNVPTIAVDTHVERVSKRLGFAKSNDSVLTVEHKLERKFPRESWTRLHHQIVLFGRYYCKARNPECTSCKFKNICKYYKQNSMK
ncbi:MAG TPA: endonuclease III [Bacilli bacterium]|nr:endonuclease III [Bacilli bacterium]